MDIVDIVAVVLSIALLILCVCKAKMVMDIMDDKEYAADFKKPLVYAFITMCLTAFLCGINIFIIVQRFIYK